MIDQIPNKSKIVLIAGIILTSITLIAGVTVFVVVERHAEELQSKRLQLSLQNQIQAIETEIENVIEKVELISTRPLLIQKLQLADTNRHSIAAQSALNNSAQSLALYSTAFIKMYGKDGQERASAGIASRQSELAVLLTGFPGHVELIWDGQLLLRVVVDMKKKGSVIGKVMMEYPLHKTMRHLKEPTLEGETGELVICIPTATAMQCLPTALNPKIFTAPYNTPEGVPLPMSHALEGRTGYLVTRDYRNQMVTAAYAPVGDYGLGLVLKMDFYELHSALGRSLNYVISIIVILIIIALLLLRWLLSPLILQMTTSANELSKLNSDLAFQNTGKDRRVAELVIANEKKDQRAEELVLANIEKDKRAEELVIANEKKDQRAEELVLANIEKDKRAEELVIANEEKEQRAETLVLANIEKDQRAKELIIANEEKDRRVAELVIANEKKDQRAAELVLANIEKDQRAEELVIANEEKEQRAETLVLANIEKDQRAKELIIANEEKDKRVAELVIANEEKEEARQEADTAKSEFIATVSHELRTPLTSIKGALGLMQSGVFDKSPDKLPEIIGIAYKNAERLSQLIDDILDIERLNVGKMTFRMESVDVSSLLEEAALSVESYGSQYGVTFLCAGTDEPLLVNGDHHRLIQVMANLLSNAAKFSHRDGQVDLSVTRHDGSIRVSVQDYGIGIPESARTSIFDNFTQVDSSDQRSKGGSGLGLGIAKKIVEAHDGQINFTSEIDKGTTFYFDLTALMVSTS
jgi:signal transduction histidine kinase